MAVRTPPAAWFRSRTSDTLRLHEQVEHVVVGRGLVLEDEGERVAVERPKVVDPASNAQAGCRAGGASWVVRWIPALTRLLPASFAGSVNLSNDRSRFTRPTLLAVGSPDGPPGHPEAIRAPHAVTAA